ncbi:MAG: zf-HC2 domain-containing protein [Acidobacteriota bacterium]|nr:zf-HC2 domain-containing protein [Blastocatellia bacterium]MDW8239924.1 zf-HC2 domain-containing protein [Acidobacteriota bacterium]
MMECKQLVTLLSEFIDGQLPAHLCQEIQAHIADCAPCVAFVNTLRKTIQMCQELPHHPLPDEMKNHLKEVLQNEWSNWKPHAS